jgi:carboxyl-terminal processing protease
MLRLLCVTGGILLIAGGISAHNAPIASGEQPLVQVPTLPENDSQSLIDAGLRIEESLQWGDAIHHYESGLRKHAGNATMQQRLLICRLHYDVVRRYQDSSFLQSIKETPTHQSLDLYAEVLANIETHYVDGVDWKKIARHGSASLEVAMAEPSFINHLLPNASPEAIESFRQNVHTHVIHRDVKSRHDLRAIAAVVSGLAKDDLGLSGTATVMEFACGALSALDTYSRFLTPGQLDETFSSIEGNFVGLGVELKAAGDRLMILSVIADGPAAQVGLVAGDAIVRVAGASTSEVNPDYAADLLRGPEGSMVEVAIVKADGTKRMVQVQRRRVDVPCVENVHIVDTDAGIGYLRLTNFQKTTTREIEKALWDLHRMGMKSLVVDVRGNPGGLLSAAVEVADRFLPSGRIVTSCRIAPITASVLVPPPSKPTTSSHC